MKQAQQWQETIGFNEQPRVILLNEKTVAAGANQRFLDICNERLRRQSGEEE